MESLLTKVADYLVTQSWQMSILFVLVAAVCWAVRKGSAHWRYLLWLIVLAKCLVPAPISVPLAVMPQTDSSQPTPSPAVPTPIAMSTTTVEPAWRGITVSEPEMAIEGFNPLATPIMPTRQKVAEPSSIPAAKTISRIGLNVRVWIAMVWLAGVGLFLAYLSLRAWTMHRRLRRWRRVADLEIRTMVATLTTRLNLKNIPNVYIAKGIAQPFVWGWLRGSIYLPEQFLNSVPCEQRQAILTHELAHILRWDVAVNLVQLMTQAAFFFHPLIWWTNRQIRREREKCCDEFVIASSVTDPKQYSQAIVNALVAEYESNQSVPSLAVAGRLKNIEERIQTILNPRGRFYRRPSWVAVATVACLAACVLPTAFVLTARGSSAEPQRVNVSQPTPPSRSLSDAAAKTQEKPAASVADTETWKPGQVIDFRVINAKTKEPLPDVKLELQFHGPGIDFQDVKVQATDAEGRSQIRLPDLRPDAVRVYPSKAGFVPLRVYWGDDLPSPKLPKAVTIPMQPGTVWGGVVQDEQGNPIPDVKVCVHYWEKGTEFNPHLRTNICVEDTIRTTDREGRWQLDIMPAKFGEDGPCIFLTHPDYVSDHLQRGRTPMPVTERPSYDALRAQTAVMVMRKGGTIEGRVIDETGRPISAVRIHNKERYWFDSGKPAATTGEDGRFRIANVSLAQSDINNPPPDTRRAIQQRKVALVVQAHGYTPELIHTDPKGSASPLGITLKPGQAVQGRVTDESGKPVEGVTVSVSNWLGYRTRLNLQTKTDGDGKFRLTDAPSNDALYIFYKKGYMAVRDFSMSPRRTEPSGDKGYQITLRPAVRIVGSILDAETNKPLAKCRLMTGWETEIGGGRTITDGRYEIVLNEHGLTWIRVEADGYMPAVSRHFKLYDPDRGVVTYDFRMTKAVPTKALSMSGTVLGLDDQPLVGAEVFLAKQQFSVKDGTVSPYARRTSRMVKTDAQGRFRFPPEVEPFYLIVLHEQGHIVLDEKQFAKTPSVRIAPWQSAKRSILLQRKQINYSGGAPEDERQTLNVRIVDAEGKPVKGANVASSAEFRTGYNYLGDNEPAWDYFRNVISDQDGRARVADQGYIACVVARHVERRLVAIQRISPDQVKSSETVTITLQPQCKVFGKLTAKQLEARNRKIQWSNVCVDLGNAFARPLSCMSDRADFHFYLPPGTYRLEAYATDTQHAMTQYAQKTITVKPGQEELEVEPIDLPPTGLVLLEGKPAPELRDIVAWKNGGPVKLSDLKGKVVVLAFSTPWAANRPHEWMPNLFTICDKYRDQGLALVDIRLDGRGIDSQAKLDERIAEVKSPFWEDRDLPIPIALALWNRPPFLRNGEEKKVNGNILCAIFKDYGIVNDGRIRLPSSVLIDRQGRIVGEFDLRSDRDNAVLERMLKEK